MKKRRHRNVLSADMAVHDPVLVDGGQLFGVRHLAQRDDAIPFNLKIEDVEKWKILFFKQKSF
jgi:hypothetical protein